MSKNGYVRARIEPELKEDVEGLLAAMGLSPSQAITLFYTQIRLNRAIPFEIKVPANKELNNETIAAMTEDISEQPRYKSAKEMFKGLGL
jgi:DNA-damage-inducible protein J